MTGHPGKTQPQRRALDQIGAGNSCPPMTARTRDALLRKGLIERRGVRTIGQDALGKIELPVYEMPIPVHMQWCAYWAEGAEEQANPDNGSSQKDSDHD